MGEMKEGGKRRRMQGSALRSMTTAMTKRPWEERDWEEEEEEEAQPKKRTKRQTMATTKMPWKELVSAARREWKTMTKRRRWKERVFEEEGDEAVQAMMKHLWKERGSGIGVVQMVRKNLKDQVKGRKQGPA